MILRLLLAILPTLLLAAIIVVPVWIYVMYMQGSIGPKSMMIQNPANGTYTRVDLEAIKHVELGEGVDSLLIMLDGTQMSIKTKDAQRLMRRMPTMD